MDMKQTIVNVDGNDVRRLGVSLILKESFSDYQIIDTPSLKTYIRQNVDVEPGIVVLGDLQMTSAGILDLINFGKLFSNTLFVVYSDLKKGDNLNKYLDLGICGLMATSEVPSELANCVEAVLQGKKFLSPSLMENFLSRVYSKEETPAPSVRLSRREMQVARYLYNGMKINWIATYLNLTSSSISTIKRNIFNKLEVSNTEELSKKMRIHYYGSLGG
jgi:two-component system invasion response regulator UvrY